MATLRLILADATVYFRRYFLTYIVVFSVPCCLDTYGANAQITFDTAMRVESVIDLPIKGSLEHANIQQVCRWLQQQVGIRLIYTHRMGQTGDFTIDQKNTTVRDVLWQLERADHLRLVRHDWEILILSPADDGRIANLDLKTRNAKSREQVAALEELLSISDPLIYPTLLYVMAKGERQIAARVMDELVQGHAPLLRYSPSLDHCIAGFQRVMQEKPALQWVYFGLIPHSVLEQIAATNDEIIKPILDQCYGPPTFMDLDQLVAGLKTALPTPDNWPLCGTGYVHVYNHEDFAYAISNLRTDEAHDVLLERTQEIMRLPHAERDYSRLVCLCNCLMPWGDKEHLDIVTEFVSDLARHQSGVLSIDGYPTTRNSVESLAKSISKMNDPLYTEAIRSMTSFDSLAVRTAAVEGLVRMADPSAVKAGLKYLDSVTERLIEIGKRDEANVAYMNEYLESYRCRVAASLGSLHDSALDDLFRRRTDETHWQNVAVSYLTVSPDRHSTNVLRRLLNRCNDHRINAVRIELLSRDDAATLEWFQASLRQVARNHLAGFRSGQLAGVPFFSGMSTLDHFFCERPQSVTFALSLLESPNAKDERLIGALILANTNRTLITPAVRKQLESWKNDDVAEIRKLVRSVLRQ